MGKITPRITRPQKFLNQYMVAFHGGMLLYKNGNYAGTYTKLFYFK